MTTVTMKMVVIKLGFLEVCWLWGVFFCCFCFGLVWFLPEALLLTILAEVLFHSWKLEKSF